MGPGFMSPTSCVPGCSGVPWASLCLSFLIWQSLLLAEMIKRLVHCLLRVNAQ